MHVPFELFDQPLVAVEDGVEGSLVAGKIGCDKLLKGGGIAVVGAPEFRDLAQTALNARTLLLAICGDQLGFQFGAGRLHP